MRDKIKSFFSDPITWYTFLAILSLLCAIGYAIEGVVFATITYTLCTIIYGYIIYGIVKENKEGK
jgi:hypothetical protein